MHVLVTGGAGFIGSHLVDRLVGLGCDVTVLDNLDPQVHGRARRRPSYLSRKPRFVRADVRDAVKARRCALSADVIFHFAAAVGVGQSQYEIARYTDVNVGGTARLLQFLAAAPQARKRLRKVLVASSMSAYGEGAYECRKCGRVRPPLRRARPKRSWDPPCPRCAGALRPVPTREEDPFHCTSVYAVTKMAQEELVLNFGAAYGVPAVGLRFFNVYGPRQSLSNPYTGVCAIFLSRVKNGRPPTIYEDGQQLRDFVSVHDIADGCVRAMRSPRADGQVINLGAGGATSVLEVAETVLERLGSTMEPEVLGTLRSGDVRHCYADIARARELLGYRPKVEFRGGMSELIDWAKTAWAEDRFEGAQAELVARGLVRP